MQNNVPVLVSLKHLNPEFEKLKKITLTNQNFTIGSSQDNSVIIQFPSIRNRHCIFKKTNDDNWIIEDCSNFGIEINGYKLGKGKKRKLRNKDVIKLEACEEFIFEFVQKCDEVLEIPQKRVKRENGISKDLVNDVKLKFEAFQSSEIKYIENKIENTQQLQRYSMLLKKRLRSDMDGKIAQLEKKYALRIDNLQGEEYEVEKQTMVMDERCATLDAVRSEMEEKLFELMTQIKKHNKIETELLNEKFLLNDKLIKEREEFLSELNRESSSKQDLLEKLKSKFREQEEIRLKEKRELEEVLHKRAQQLRLANEKELKEQKNLWESELEQEQYNTKKTLQKQIDLHRMKTEQILTKKMEQMKKLKDEEKIRNAQLVQEREEIKKKLREVQINAEKAIEKLRNKVIQREKHAEQLQEHVDKVKRQLQSVENENLQLVLSLSIARTTNKGNSKTIALMSEVEKIMENELKCGICAELFIEAVTLGCMHTFCKYCITMWKNNKIDCAICRTPIITECRSLSLDSFIDKMIENLTEEAKHKRQFHMDDRKEEMEALEKGLTPIISLASSSMTSNPTSLVDISDSLQRLSYSPIQTMTMGRISEEVADYSFQGSWARATGAAGASSTAAPEDTGHSD